MNDNPGYLKIQSVEELIARFSYESSIISKYDESFFENQYLLFVSWTEGNAARNHKIWSVDIHDRLITVRIAFYDSETVAITVRTPYCAVIELPASLSDRDVSVIQHSRNVPLSTPTPIPTPTPTPTPTPIPTPTPEPTQTTDVADTPEPTATPPNLIDVSVSVGTTVTNNDITDKPVTVIFTMYDSDGRIVGMISEKETIPAGANVIFTCDFDGKQTSLVKIFIWDDLASMNPISDVIQIITCTSEIPTI